VGTKPSRTKQLERLDIEYLPLSAIKPYKGNPRKNQAAIQKVMASLREFGWRQPIVVDKAHVIVVGHTRYEAAKYMGEYDAPVHVAHNLTSEQCKAYRLADNRTGEEAGWDEDKLAREISEIMHSGQDPLTTGFERPELDRLLGIAATLDANDGTPTEPEPVPDSEPITQPGDVWLLGAHRLMCGDSTNAEHVAHLMQGEKADLVNMDPPYGVDKQNAKLGTIDGDKLTRDKLLALLIPAFNNAVRHTQDRAAFYIWHGGGPRRRDFEFAMDAVGLEEKSYISWVKEHFVLGRADYHWQTEPCFYAQKRGQEALFYGGRAQSNVWRLELQRSDRSREIIVDHGLHISDGAGNQLYISRYLPRNKKPRHLRILNGQSLIIADSSQQTDAWLIMRDQDRYQHPTQKPVGLGVRAIENSTVPGQVVLDLFGGGGFTLLAAEETGRQGRVMELKPRWCDVIVSRWAKATNKEPRRA
jgi:DNA modification methylase